MAEKTPMKSVEGEGILGGVVTAVADVLQSVTRGSLGAASDLREAYFGSTRDVLDWIESMQKRNIGLAKSLTDRIDTLLMETTSSTETLLQSSIDRGRETGHGVADLVARTGVSLSGKTEPRKAA